MLLRHALCATALLAACPALAAPGDPVKIGGGFTLDPIVEGRLRYETVDTPTLDADAVTLRLRAGAELKHASGLSALVEGEGTLALVKDYNAFAFPIADSQRRPGFALIADPMTVELNRAQLQYRTKVFAVTIGRQRVNYDDQRWFGNGAPFRQNDQTYDAVRGEAKLGPVALDATYAIAMRTPLGADAGPRTAYDGDFWAANAGVKAGPVQLKAFAYLLDFDPKEQTGPLAVQLADTQTYGARATASVKLSRQVTLNLAASAARQSGWKDNPFDFAAIYLAGEAGIAAGPFGVSAGYERLGSDNGHAVQTPFAALHRFNGWADQFLTTPAGGLTDLYGGVSIKFPKVKALPGLNAAVTYHRFGSDAGGLHYGNEWNAILGFKLGRTALLAKFADYDADAAGVDTRKLWLQIEFAY